jgi:hypothetical protein
LPITIGTIELVIQLKLNILGKTFESPAYKMTLFDGFSICPRLFEINPIICSNSDAMCGYEIDGDKKLEKKISIANPNDEKDKEEFTVQLVNCPINKTKRIYQKDDDTSLTCKSKGKTTKSILNQPAYDIYRKA